MFAIFAKIVLTAVVCAVCSLLMYDTRKPFLSDGELAICCAAVPATVMLLLLAMLVL